MGFATRFLSGIDPRAPLRIVLAHGHDLRLHCVDARGEALAPHEIKIEAIGSTPAERWSAQPAGENGWILTGLPATQLKLRVVHGEATSEFDLDPLVGERRLQLDR